MGLDKWTAMKPALLAGSYHSIAYGNGWFVAVGPSSTSSIVGSPDEGASWDLRPIPATLYSVACGEGGIFVAVGKYKHRWDSVNSAWASAKWSSDGNAEIGFLRAIAHGRLPQNVPLFGKLPVVGLFVAVGDAGRIITSRDGITWAVVAWPTTWGPVEDLTEIAHGNGLFVIAGAAGSVITSPDGVN